MIKFIKKKYYKYEEIVNYLFVGGLTTFVSIASYFLFSKFFMISYMISTILSWILAVTFAYFMNKSIVFKSKNENIVKEFINFIKYRLLSLLIEMVAMYMLVDLISINDGFSKIIVQFIVLILNYLFSKIFVFKEKRY